MTKLHDKVDKKEDFKSKEGDIIKELSKLSEKLQDTKDHGEKIKLLVEFDKFLKNNKEFIKEKCPDKIVSILRSL